MVKEYRPWYCWISLYALTSIDGGHDVFALSICPAVFLSAKKCNIGHNFRVVSDLAFTCAKVICQGYMSVTLKGKNDT